MTSAATAAEASTTTATTARLTAQRTRPPRRGAFAGGTTGLAGTGPDAHATSCSNAGAVEVAWFAGVKGAVGVDANAPSDYVARSFEAGIRPCPVERPCGDGEPGPPDRKTPARFSFRGRLSKHMTTWTP